MASLGGVLVVASVCAWGAREADAQKRDATRPPRPGATAASSATASAGKIVVLEALVERGRPAKPVTKIDISRLLMPEQSVFPAVFRALHRCRTERKLDPRGAWQLGVDLAVTPPGDVRQVRTTSSTAAGRALASCVGQALAASKVASHDGAQAWHYVLAFDVADDSARLARKAGGTP